MSNNPAAPGGGNTSVSSAFTRTPGMAQVFRDQYARAEAAAAQSESQQPVQQPVQQPPIDPYMLMAQQQQQQRQVALMTQQTQQLAQERDSLANQLAEMQKRNAEFEVANQQQAMLASLDNADELNALETVDPADARRIAVMTARMLKQPIDSVAAEVKAQRENIERNRVEALNATQQAQIARYAGEILQVHPDFYNLFNDPAFLQYLQEPDGLSSRSRDQAATQEFYAGNTRYVIDIVDKFKQHRPDNGKVTTVPPVQVAGGAATPATSSADKPTLTLAELNSLYQMRRISPDEYRTRLKELRAAG